MTGYKSRIELAAEHAVTKVLPDMIADFRKRPTILEFQVKEGLSVDEKTAIQNLGADLRFNFVLTPDEGKVEIYGFANKSFINEQIQKYKNFKIEIWQGESEEIK